MKAIQTLLFLLLWSHSFAQYSIRGSVYRDDNNNCIKEQTEPALSNIPVLIVLQGISQQRFLVNTNNNGEYVFETNATGSYDVTISNTNFYRFCTSSMSPVIITPNNFNTTKNFGASLQLQCPLIEVHISSLPIRFCESNTYHVQYKNIGGELARNLYIDIDFNNLQFTSNNPFNIFLNNNIYRFPLPDLESGTSGDFSIVANVGCNPTLRGRTVCVKAEAKRYENCLPVLNQPVIEVKSTCDGDSVEFQIKNRSNVNMNAQQRYWVFEDDVMDRIGQYQLNANEVKTLRFAVNSGAQTKRLETEQPAIANPNLVFYAPLYPSSFIEACGSNAGAVFQNFALEYASPDEPVWLDIDCQEIRDSIPSFSKTAIPRGMGPNHYVEKKKPINYTISFKQPMIATNYLQVHIIDSLDTNFNLTSFQLLNKNVNVTHYFIDNNNVLHCFIRQSMPNYQNYFIKYTLTPKESTLDSTVIRNRASVNYLDNTGNIVETHQTNRTFHTTYAKIKAVKDSSILLVTSNIFTINDFKIFNLENKYVIETPFIKGDLKIIDALGRLLLNTKIDNNVVEFATKEFSTAIFYCIFTDKNNVTTIGLINN